MPLGEYKIQVSSPEGVLQASYDNFRRLEIRHIINEPDTCKLTLNGAGNVEDNFETNSIVEVLRQVPGYEPKAIALSRRRAGNWYVEWDGLHTDAQHTTYVNGDEVFMSYCDGALDFAKRRSVLWFATLAASQSKKVGIPTQLAIYEYVNENCGPAALASSGRLVDGTIVGLTVTPVGAGLGPNWSGARAWRNVLEVIQEIGNYGSIDFDIIRASGATWTFETYIDQLGADRTVTGLDSTTGLNGAGNAPVIFSLAANNVEQVTYKSSRQKSANVVVALGKGQWAARDYGVSTDSSELDANRINQREVTRNAATQDTQTELDALADEWQARLQATEDFSFVPLRGAAATIYGVDYWWGDQLTARYRELERNKRLLGVTIVVDQNGERFSSWNFETIPRV